MSGRFADCLARVLRHEGGYVNHPRDPGGETNYGITVATARAHGYSGSMRDIPIDAVERIYRAGYWERMRCDELPAGLDYAAFDYGVNSGPARAVKALQLILGVNADGIVGPVTLDAVARRDAAELVGALCDRRLRFLQALPTWGVFGRGWARRIAEVRGAAMAMTSPAAIAVDRSSDQAEPQTAPLRRLWDALRGKA